MIEFLIQPMNILILVFIIFMTLGFLLWWSHRNHSTWHEKIDRNYAKLHYIEIEQLKKIIEKVDKVHDLVNKNN